MAPHLPAPGLAPTLAVVDGIPTTTSIDVARHFGKRHDDVLRTIRNLCEQLDPDHARNFAEMVVETEIGSGATRKDPAFRLTRDAFTLLAMGFTGARALKFKLAYIDAFNRMEAELSVQRALPKPPVNERAMREATLAGLATAAHVQAAFIDQILHAGQSDEDASASVRGQRWITYFDGRGKPVVHAVEAGATVVTLKTLAELIAMPDTMYTTKELVALAQACVKRLGSRLGA